MKKITLLFLFAIIAGASHAQQFSANLLFTAHLTGAQETPAVQTEADGVASFILNATHDTMCVMVTVKGLSGPITSVNIYEGDTSVVGPIAIPLTNINGYTVMATLTGASVSDSSIAKFLDGHYYISINTAANPAGEIRGQIMLETDHAFVALIEGAQEVPPVLSNAIGIVIIDLYRNMERADIFAQFTGLNSLVVGFSLFQGTPSVNGLELANYDTVINGNVINIEVDDSIFLNDLMAGNVYVNVRTQNNLTGELRGQFSTSNKLAFDMRLDGAQETPPTASFATGLGIMTTNGTMDTLWYDIIFDSLTATPTAAHFHTGAEGAPGPVVIDLTSSISGNRISGFLTDPAIPADFINNALMGNVYVNIHNANYPNGEIRGQVDRYAREGFTYMINGTQETPPNASPATGSGFLSLDRELENVHFEAIVNGLSDTLIDAHLHRAPSGLPGPVIFPLNQLIATPFNDTVAVYGDWTDDDNPPFDTATVAALFANEVYINFHTQQYPNGEVRGQVIQGGDCFETITAVQVFQNESGEFVIYPVPSSDIVSVDYTAKSGSDVRMVVYDISGRVVSAEKFSAVAGMNKMKVDISRFNPGVYFIKVENSGKQMFYGKLIKG
jgi:hypothetical protein